MFFQYLALYVWELDSTVMTTRTIDNLLMLRNNVVVWGLLSSETVIYCIYKRLFVFLVGALCSVQFRRFAFLQR